MSHGTRIGMSPHPISGWSISVSDKGEIPRSSTQVNNHFPSLAPRPKTPNPYLTYLINFRATGQVGVRFANCAEAGTVARAMSNFAMFQGPRLRGSGSCVAPHATWGSVEQTIRSSDLVFLLPGEHVECALSNIHAVQDRPIVIMPVAYDPSASNPLTSNSNLPWKDETTIRADSGPAVKCSNCSAIRFCGLKLMCNLPGSAGVVAENSEGLHFEQNQIMADVMCSFDGENPMAANNVHMFASATASIRAALQRTYPSPFLILSYLLVWGVYVMLSMMCLFVTSAMSEAEADEWIVGASVSITIKVLVVTPFVAVFKTGIEFSTAVMDIQDMDLGFE